MADVKISQLPAASVLTGTELIEAVQGGTNKKSTPADLKTYLDTVNGVRVGRNFIINGGFDTWERATSQTSSGYGSDDRWINGSLGSTKVHSQQAFTVGQSAVPGNPAFFSRTVVTSVAGAGNYVDKVQAIEDVRNFAGKTATLSFWAKADASKNIAVAFAQNFGTGGSPSALVAGIGVTTIPLTSAWQFFTVTVNVPSISGKTLGSNNNHYFEVDFWFDAGSNYNARTNSLGQQSGTFDIAQVKLEEGSVATPFCRAGDGTVAEEQLLCKRYFEKVDLYYYSNVVMTDVRPQISFTVKKRTVPSITVFDNLNAAGKINLYLTNGTSTAGQNVSSIQGIDVLSFVPVFTAGTMYGYLGTATADCEL